MEKINTPKFRVSYPNVFKPEKPMDPEDPPRFTLEALFAKDEDLSKLKKLATDALIKEWGADKTKWPTNLRSPFKNQGDKKTKEGKIREGYEDGAIYLTIKSKTRPAVVDKDPSVEILEERDFYPGCYARASVVALTYKVGTPGVSFWFNNIQKLAEGDPLGGRSRPTDDFESVVDEAASDDSAGGIFD